MKTDEAIFLIVANFTSCVNGVFYQGTNTIVYITD